MIRFAQVYLNSQGQWFLQIAKKYDLTAIDTEWQNHASLGNACMTPSVDLEAEFISCNSEEDAMLQLASHYAQEMALHMNSTSQVVAPNIEMPDDQGGQDASSLSTAGRNQEELTAGLEKLRQLMIEDYDRSGFNMGYDVEFEFGSKYIRVIHNDKRGSRSCAGFVCCDRKHKQFEFGALLKCATWKAPAMNKARGSVFELEGKRVAWTGIQ